MMGNWANMNAGLNQHNNVQSIYGIQQAQKMQQITSRYFNPFGNPNM